MVLISKSGLYTFLGLLFVLMSERAFAQEQKTKGGSKFFVTVDDTLLIFTTPPNAIYGTILNICPDKPRKFVLTSQGSPSLCNPPQWKRNGIPIPNATSFTLIVSDTGTYSIDVNCPRYYGTLFDVAVVSCIIS
jgi:hypothetical protein